MQFKTLLSAIAMFATVVLLAGCPSKDDGGGDDDSGGGGGGGGTNVAPTITIDQAPVSGVAGTVAFLYSITDPDSITADVTVEAEDQASPGTWVDLSSEAGPNSEALTGLSSSTTGNQHLFEWDTSAWATTAAVSVIVRFTANDGTDTGAPAMTAAFSIDNSGGGIVVTAPDVYIPTPTLTLYGNSFLPYSLIETNTTQQPSNTVSFQYSTDGVSYSDCTEANDTASEGLTGLLATARGRDHLFVWDTAADIAGTETGVTIRVQATNSVIGTPVTTGTFTVDNVTAPTRGAFAGMSSSDLGAIDNPTSAAADATTKIDVHYAASGGGSITFVQPDSGTDRLYYRTFDNASTPTLSAITPMTAAAPTNDQQVVWQSSVGEYHAMLFREVGGNVNATRFDTTTGAYSTPTQVDTNMYGQRGHIAAHATGEVVAIWVDPGAGNMRASCWDDTTGGFTPAVDLTPAGVSNGDVDVSVLSIEYTLTGNAHIIFAADDGTVKHWHVFFSAHDNTFSPAQALSYTGTGAGDIIHHSTDLNSATYGGRVLSGGTEFMQNSVLPGGNLLAVFCQNVSATSRGLSNIWNADENDDAMAWQGPMFIDDNQTATRTERVFFNSDLLNKHNPREGARVAVWQGELSTGEWVLFANSFDGSAWSVQDAASATALTLSRIDNGTANNVTYAEFNQTLAGHGILTYTQNDAAGDHRLYSALFDAASSGWSTPAVTDNCVAGEDVLLEYSDSLAGNAIVFPTLPDLYSFQGVGAAVAVLSYRAERDTNKYGRVGVAVFQGNNSNWLASTWVSPHESDVVDGNDTAGSIAGNVEAKILGLVFPDRNGDAMCVGARLDTNLIPDINMNLRYYDGTTGTWAASTSVNGSNPVFIDLGNLGALAVPGLNANLYLNPDWTNVDGTSRVMAAGVMNDGGNPRLHLYIVH